MKAYELLSAPEKWTQGTYARNNQGSACGTDDPAAVSWCILGAMAHCYHDAYFVIAYNKLNPSDTDLVEWNDAEERTFDEVIALLKKYNI